MDRTELSQRVQRERRFADAEPRAFRRVRGWIFRAIGAFNRSGDMHEAYDPTGKVVLDYGCGLGALSFGLLDRGASRTVGIDVSSARLAQARRRAGERGLGDQAHFLVVDAHRTAFRDGAFDLVVGKAILHHLDLRAALLEIRRILAPGGRAVFQEPLAHNPLLRVGRALTPWARTRDEHPLTEDDWKLCASIFPRFRHDEREFVTIPLMPVNFLLPRRAQQAWARRLSRLDDRTLARYPGLRKHARITILVLE
jgi:SAM-dependent methyltransferase